ncbi:hypothetical protein KVR01_002713 [Diaporthe batatas]|uniref:uncharacterized protein n=1 Tax=Diaporthe batatas TaxID=748121 RepID=UPI001D03EAEF|nr:uncharacterized protein KVR01_002713 [Diaporthe batatas]KAG8167024.1 hypothetical protein KVR01_002713 [Diaporthe batatas]
MSASEDKPVIVGIYGVSGCGKTTLVERLKTTLGEKDFSFFDGSQILSSLVRGGLAAFKQKLDSEKAVYREIAIQHIAAKCQSDQTVGIVAGHLTLWTGNGALAIHTQADLDTYTHILYLDTPPETIFEYRLNDNKRDRPDMSVEDLRRWQWNEKSRAKTLCRQHGIMFINLRLPLEPGMSRALNLMRDIRDHSEQENLRRALARLDDIVAPLSNKIETILVLDADRTLAPLDTGARFWGEHLKMGEDGSNRLKQFFGHSVWGYSYKAFRQAAWLYEEIPEPEFERLCQVIAEEVNLHPELADLLHSGGKLRHIRAVVVTCGIKRIWEVVLQRVQSSAHVDIIGGGRISDSFVVTPEVKAAVVERLRKHYGVQVYAFGDSEVDIPMLRAADRAYVVTGDVETRSKSMDQALLNAISSGLCPRQILLPPGSRPRLAEGVVPIVEMNAAFFHDILARRSNDPQLGRVHATGSAAAKILMTPMRDAGVAGPGLREAHRNAGWWIATQHVSEMIGCEEIKIPHVQNHQTEGYRLRGEDKTTIVALMRGGEPMALGVSEAFPAAVFVHAKTRDDLTEQYIRGQSTILLVDSVVNSGKTIVGFIEHIRSIEKSVRIVVVAGVIQAKFFTNPVAQADRNVGLVAMRLSENEFKGKGQTDTGNRLFNTTQLD